MPAGLWMLMSSAWGLMTSGRVLRGHELWQTSRTLREEVLSVESALAAMVRCTVSVDEGSGDKSNYELINGSDFSFGESARKHR